MEKNKNGSFFFLFFFFLSTTVEPKIIYISNQIEMWKKYTEKNTALEVKKKKSISNRYSAAD